MEYSLKVAMCVYRMHEILNVVTKAGCQSVTSHQVDWQEQTVTVVVDTFHCRHFFVAKTILVCVLPRICDITSCQQHTVWCQPLQEMHRCMFLQTNTQAYYNTNKKNINKKFLTSCASLRSRDRMCLRAKWNPLQLHEGTNACHSKKCPEHSSTNFPSIPV